jgi:hypothetical protein
VSPDWPVLMVIAMAVGFAVLAGLLAATLVSHVD